MEFHPMSDPAGRHRHDSNIHVSQPSPNSVGQTAWHGISRDELNARRRAIEATIEAEGDAAVNELEEKLNISRTHRRRSRRTRLHHQDNDPSREEEEAEERVDDMYTICNILMDEYGVEVEPLAKGAREPIYSRKVKAAVPVDGKGAQHRASERYEEMRYTERRRDETESSDEEDEILVKSMSRGRPDLLKAETGISGSTPGLSRSSFRHDAPIRRESSGYRHPYRMRHAPYSMRPPNLYEPHSRHEVPHHDSDDHSDSWVSATDDERIILEVPPYGHRLSHRPRRGDKRRSIDDEDSDEDPILLPRPRGPGPGPGPGSRGPEVLMVPKHEPEDKESREARRRKKESLRKKEEALRRKEEAVEENVVDHDRTRRRRPVVNLHRPTYYAEPRNTRYDHDIRRTRSYGEPTTHVSPADYETHESLHSYRETAETQPQPANIDVHMSGARHADDEISGRHGSDDDRLLIVRHQR